MFVLPHVVECCEGVFLERPVFPDQSRPFRFQAHHLSVQVVIVTAVATNYISQNLKEKSINYVQ